ncbi:MAG TPA: peptidylprolyl isomerase [Mariprofundaceae bacterium]|nr:peptidylprolyl isomerase [Mariprofundaceae bacterium]
MNNKITWLLLPSLLLLLAGCQPEQPQEPTQIDSTPIVAKAGGITFHESDIDREIHAMPDTLQHIASDPIARSQILNVLIRRSILSKQAREIGLDHNPQIVSQIERAQNTILIEALENWQTSQTPSPTEKQIAQYYKNHLDDFTIPEQIHARHILVASEKLAWQILKQLGKSRDNFAALAATHSLDDSNKSRGGDLNWFPRGIMVKPFEKVAFSLKEGGISKPVKTQFGWHIIEALGKRPAHIKSIDEARDEIDSILLQKALDQWIAKLVSTANVTILNPEYQLSKEEPVETDH